MPRVQLLSAEAAWKLLQGPLKVVPVDATWYMPNSPKDAKEQFVDERVPGSVFFDLDKISLPSKFPHMLPSQRVFDENVGKLGISPRDSVLVYDRTGVFSSPRAAWTFSLYGHEKVFLLDHYALYKAHFHVDLAPATVPEPIRYPGIANSDFAHNFRSQVIEFEELSDLVGSGEADKYYILDARSVDRFSGAAPEPRAGLSSGHIPGAFNLPFPKVLNADGHYKSADELHALFKLELGIDLRTDLAQKAGIIVMCGTGVTAVILRLAIERVVPDAKIRVYDGSWTEWAQRAPELIVKD